MMPEDIVETARTDMKLKFETPIQNNKTEQLLTENSE